MDEGIEIRENEYEQYFHRRQYLLRTPVPAAAARAALEFLLGVEEVGISRYQVTIQKGRAFNWDEVQPAVLTYLQSLSRAG
jgi:hypothetical protein